MTKEKRRFTRFPFDTKVELSVNEKIYAVDKIVNLSIGGCLLPISVDIEPETSCTVKINLGSSDDGPVVKVGGHIFRSGEGSLAIKFTSIDPDSLYHLQNIARFNAPDPERIEEELEKHPGLI